MSNNFFQLTAQMSESFKAEEKRKDDYEILINQEKCILEFLVAVC